MQQLINKRHLIPLCILFYNASVCHNAWHLFIHQYAPGTVLISVCFSASLLQDPAGIFELIEVVGNGTYGQVYKVSLVGKTNRSIVCAKYYILYTHHTSEFINRYKTMNIA